MSDTRILDGKVAEAEFLLEATKRGLEVIGPLGANPDFDFIVARLGGLVRVQVKSSKLREGYSFQRKGETYRNFVKPHYRFIVTGNPRRKIRRFSGGGSDVLAMWLRNERRWLFAHSRDLDVTGISLFTHRTYPFLRDWSIFDAPKIDTISSETSAGKPSDLETTTSSP